MRLEFVWWFIGVSVQATFINDRLKYIYKHCRSIMSLQCQEIFGRLLHLYWSRCKRFSYAVISGQVIKLFRLKSWHVRSGEVESSYVVGWHLLQVRWNCVGSGCTVKSGDEIFFITDETRRSWCGIRSDYIQNSTQLFSSNPRGCSSIFNQVRQNFESGMNIFFPINWKVW